MSTPRINWWIALVAFWWWMMETSWFGWNITPESEYELLADGLAMLIFAIALAAPPKLPVKVLIRQLGNRSITTIEGEADINVSPGRDA